MKRNYHLLSAFLPAVGMAMLILDSKTAITGAKEGLSLCLQTAIPCLFPFFVMSNMLTVSLVGRSPRLLLPIRNLCRIPEGAEGILLIGLLGGYPVGAQSITQAYQSGSLSKEDARRLLGFCSNAGPSFIFGIVGNMFSTKKTLWILWFIHILSALFVGSILPHGHKATRCKITKQHADLPRAVTQSVRALCSVCGWIILMRVVITFLDRWILWMLPKYIQVLLIGFFEITNGCHMLLNTEPEFIRFVISAAMLGFGGICVSMQTVSVTQGLGTGMYFPGKILHGLISLLLSTAVAPVLYSVSISGLWTALLSLLFLCIVTTALLWRIEGKSCSIFGKVSV